MNTTTHRSLLKSLDNQDPAMAMTYASDLAEQITDLDLESLHLFTEAFHLYIRSRKLEHIRVAAQVKGSGNSETCGKLEQMRSLTHALVRECSQVVTIVSGSLIEAANKIEVVVGVLQTLGDFRRYQVEAMKLEASITMQLDRLAVLEADSEKTRGHALHFYDLGQASAQAHLGRSHPLTL